jgi:hypothetical protein
VACAVIGSIAWFRHDSSQPGRRQGGEPFGIVGRVVERCLDDAEHIVAAVDQGPHAAHRR